VILWLRLAAATGVILLPGVIVARALGRRGAAAAFTWSVALVAAALAFTFAVHGSLWLTLGLVLGIGAFALPLAVRPRQVTRCHLPGSGAVVLAGIALGALLWGIEGIVHGDALFHLGRMRKLDDFGSLSLRAVDEFKDGGLHPGYAFPLWHGWLALVAKVAAVDPTSVVLHEPSILAPLALVLAYEAGTAVFRSAWLGFGTMLAQVALIAFAPGYGGSYAALEQPASVARQLLVPTVVALFFAIVRRPSRLLGLTLAAAGMDLAFIHPTYALFLAIPLVGYVAVRARQDFIGNVGALVAYGAPVLLVFAWLAPIVSETRSHNPSATEKARQLKHYANELAVHSQSNYHLAPAVVARTGAIAVAALALVPLAGLAGRRRWSALVLGGTVLVLGIELWSLAFPHFSDLVSLSQSRRAAGFVPFAVAFVGGISVATRLVSWAVFPIALAAGIVLQIEYPGSFGSAGHMGAPAVAWVALFGGLAGIAVAAIRRGPALERPGAVAAAAAFVFTIPVFVHGFSQWHAAVTKDPYALTPGLVGYLRHDVPARSVVFADLETSYRITAYAPVYVCASPPAHVADTRANRPLARRAAVIAFLRTGDLAIPRRYHAGWIVLRARERRPRGARVVYRDADFVVFRL
jgi:hypothetical protein